jgi:peptidoglycan/xylan/chitin deacetylase (PgdA/CDA1 family)
MKTATAGILVLLALTSFPGTSLSDHRITTWPHNKKGAVSLTFDDGCKSQLFLGLSALEKRGYKGTFFLVSNSVTAWDPWRNAARSGHEIGSHTKTHPHLTKLSPPLMQNEMAGSKMEIDARIPSQECFSFAYPFGDLDRSVESDARDLYAASRGGGIACGLNGESVDFSNVKGCSPDDGNDIYGFTDAAEKQGKWLVAIFHSLDGGKDCYGSWEFNTWTAYLDYLGTRNLWVGTFGAAVKYTRERMSATLSVLSGSRNRILLNVTDTLNDAVYDEPLTIRSTVPSGWITVIVEQGDSIVEEQSTLEGESRVVYYDVVPDHGVISLRNSHAK